MLRPFEDLPDSYGQNENLLRGCLDSSPFARDGTDLEDLFESPQGQVKKPKSPYQPINMPMFKEDADMDFEYLRFGKEVFGKEIEHLVDPYMPLTSSETKSVSKNDITELENKIKNQERQIDSIKDKQKQFCTVQKENVVRRIKFLDSDIFDMGNNSSCYKESNPFLKGALFDGGSVHHF